MASLWQYVLAGIVVGAIYALIAAGFVLIYQVTGLINFAQGEFAMIGAMTAASLAAGGMPPLGAAALAVLAAAIVGALAYLLAIRPARASTGVTLIFITLGLDVALRGAALIEWGTNPYALDAFSRGRAITIFGGVLPPQAVWVLGTDLVVFAALYLFFRHSFVGTAVRAAVANPPIASTFGIPLRAFAFWSFVAAAAIGGLGGVVIAPITQATYDMGLTLGLGRFRRGGAGRPRQPARRPAGRLRARHRAEGRRRPDLHRLGRGHRLPDPRARARAAPAGPARPRGAPRVMGPTN